MSTWKHAERQIARLLGGHRLGPTGKPQPDVITRGLAVEVKHRKALPAWLLDGVDQARANADGRIPVLILHQKGQPYRDCLVILNLTDFIRLGVDNDPEGW